MCRAAFVALPALAAAALSTGARASPSSRLIYSRTPEASSCPDESALRKAVSKRFGYDPFFPWAKQTVVVQILRTRTRYIARVQLLDEEGIAHGMRELSSNQGDCSEIFEAAALAVSIALDAPAKPLTQEAPAEAQSTPPPPLPVPVPTPAATVPPAQPATREASVARDRATLVSANSVRIVFDVGADALGSIGITPLATPGVSAFVRGRLESWSLALEVRADWPESKARAVAVGGGSVQDWLIAGGIAPCLHVSYFAVCAVGLVGSFEASGQAIDPHNSASTIFLAAGARLGFEWPLSGTLSLRARVEGVANLLPATLLLGNDTIWTAWPVDGTVGLGLAARFP